MKSIKRVLYPEKDVYGEGEIVARAYWEDLENPIYILSSYDRMYIADIYIGVPNSRIYVFYSDTNIVLTLVCNMVEGKLGLL